MINRLAILFLMVAAGVSFAQSGTTTTMFQSQTGTSSGTGTTSIFSIWP